MNEKELEKEEIKEEVNEPISPAGSDSVETETEVEEEIVTEGDTLTPSDDEEGEEIVSEDGEEEIVEDTEEIPGGSDVDGLITDREAPADKMLDDTKPAEKMLTQSQVNELIGRTRQEARESAMREARENLMREMYERYGVSDEEGLNGIFGKGQIYDDLNTEYENQGNAYKSVMAENALLKSKIDPARWEDVKLILGGKGYEVNAENIEAMIATHPEWRTEVSSDGNKVLSVDDAERMARGVEIGGAAKISKLGSEPSPVSNEVTDEQRAAKLFGF